MNIFDYVLSFTNQEEALSVLSGYSIKVHERLPPTELVVDNTWTGFVIPNLQIFIPGTYDEEGNVLTPQYNFPGYHVGLATIERSAELEALANCRAVVDRLNLEYAYIAPDVDHAVLSTVCVSPVFAGSEYPGGKLP